MPNAVRGYRRQLIDRRDEMNLDARRQHLAPAIGALTCAICYLADVIHTMNHDLEAIASLPQRLR